MFTSRPTVLYVIAVLLGIVCGIFVTIATGYIILGFAVFSLAWMFGLGSALIVRRHERENE